MSPRAALGVAALLLAPFAAADQARYVVPTQLAAYVEAGQRSGLSIALEPAAGGVAVTVSAVLRALAPSPSLPLSARERCGDAEALEVPASFVPGPEIEGVRRTTTSALAAVRAVIALVSRRVRLDENDTGPQDAASVLRRGRGRCSGRANLSVGLLRAMGIPARVVEGMVVGREGPRFHRWGEAWLGPLGWLAFDPGQGVGAVSVRYVPMRPGGDRTALRRVRVERIDDRGFRGLPVFGCMRCLPEDGVTLRCLAPQMLSDLVAVLVAPDGSRWIRRGSGQVVFKRMLPGRYELHLSDGNAESAVSFVLGGAREVEISFSGERAARS
jgi:hypothetical protein